MEGHVIGQYRVTGVLGKGGMGIVYAAQHTLLDRPAAVKVLRPNVSSKQEVVTRFFNEARAATAIRHPGIVEIYDFGWAEDGSAFIVMEYLEGETLSKRRKRGLPRWNASISIVRQVAGALAAAHAKGIFHRDLKPDNIFLVPDPEVPGGERIKLIDFGIARLAGSMPSGHKTRTGTVMGTPTYMSPEQCRGVTVDSRTDIYSLGCIMFELCTGRPPFVAQTTGDVLAAHINEPPPTISSLASGVPREIEALVQRMLAKAPADRVQTASELIQLIDAAKAAIARSGRSGPQPIIAAPTPPPPPAEDGGAPDRDDRDDDETSVDPTEAAGTGRAPTVSERSPQRRPGHDAARPALAATRKGGFEAPAGAPAPAVRAAAPAPARSPAPADSAALEVPMPSQLDTTLSSAAGTRPGAKARAPSRRIAVFGGVAGVVALGIATTVALSARGDEAPTELAASPPAAVSPPKHAAAPATAGATAAPTAQPPPTATPPTTSPPSATEGGAQAPSPTVPPPSGVAGPAPSTDPKPPPAPASASPADAAAPTEPIKAKSLGDATGARSSKHSQPATILIAVDSNPRGAAIVLDGDLIGHTPWHGPMLRGKEKIKLRLRLAGHRDKELVIDKANAYNVSLDPVPPAAPAAAPAAPTAAPAAAPAAAP